MEILIEILITIIGIFIIGLFVYLLESFVWSSTTIKTSPRITFDAFKKVYAISPTKWSLDFENVSYHRDDGWIHIEFKHYIDVIRYSFFKKKIENNKDYLTKMQNEKKLIKSLQEDINSYKKENLAELERLINLESK